MLIYWVMFAIPAMAAMSTLRYHRHVTALSWLFMALLLIVIIGFRWEIGRDWALYYHHFHSLRDVALLEGLQRFYYEDMAYVLLSWIIVNIDFSISALHLICAGIFLAGLFNFCRRQPEPWIALAISIPHLVIVVSMGHTRQSVALGFIFFALAAIVERNVVRFVVFVFVAALFHKSAILLAPIGILVSTSKRFLLLVLLSLAGGLFINIQSWERSLQILHSYTSFNNVNTGIKGMASPGASFRVAMNVIPAGLFLIFWKRFKLEKGELSLWIWMSLLALSSIPQLFLIPSTTIVDRLAIYFTPVQLFVYSRFQCLFKAGVSRQLVTTIVLGVYTLFLFIWFNFGNNSFAWLPYRLNMFD
jgi:hypothetical protein